MGHTPGRGHRRKSDPPKKNLFRQRTAKKKAEADKRYDEAKRAWDELDYLCQKIRFWLYARKQKTGAARYLDRLGRILRELPENDAAIIREEGLALFYELKGELRSAIAHREREIRLTEQLHNDSQSPRYAPSTRSYMLRNREIVDLQERRAILETLKKEQARRQLGVGAQRLKPQVSAG